MDYITRRLNLKEVAPKVARKIAGKIRQSEDEVQLIRKGIAPSERDYFVEGEHAAIHYITVKQKDRDNELIIPSGVDFTDYRKTPVVLWNHHYSSTEVPLGKNIWIKPDDTGNSLIAKTVYHTAEGSMGKKVYDYLREGFPLATSIGFIPLDYVEQKDFDSLDKKTLGLENIDLSEVVRIYTKVHMLEYSLVPIPSNASAITVAVSKGLFSLEQLQKDMDDGRIYYFDFNKENELNDRQDAIEDVQTKNEGSEGNQDQIVSEERVELRQSEEIDAETKGETGEEKDEDGGDLIECNCIECDPVNGDEKAACRRKPKKEIEEIAEEKSEIDNAVTKPEVTENYIRIPVDDGDHEGHTIRTITISSDLGIRALYCVNDKKILTYLFSRDKDWTLARAEAWVEDHKGLLEGDVSLGLSNFTLSPNGARSVKEWMSLLDDFNALTINNRISLFSAFDFGESKGIEIDVELGKDFLIFEPWLNMTKNIISLAEDNIEYRDWLKRGASLLGSALNGLSPAENAPQEPLPKFEKDTDELKQCVDKSEITTFSSTKAEAEGGPAGKSDFDAILEELTALTARKEEPEIKSDDPLDALDDDELIEIVRERLVEMFKGKGPLDLSNLITEEIKKAKGELL